MGILIFVAISKEGSFTTKRLETENEHTVESRRDARTASSLLSYRTGTKYNTFKIFSQQTSHTDFERTMLKINVCSFCIPIQK